jgi:uncharacterized Zn-finger protein
MPGTSPGKGIFRCDDGRESDSARAKSVPMIPFETIEIEAMMAACDGGGGPLGHPKVYLSLAPLGRVECPYCSRLFVNRSVLRERDEWPPESPAEGSRA